MSENSARYFVVTVMIMLFVLFCGCVSLAGPWYVVSEHWNNGNGTVVSRDSHFYIYRDISMQWIYKKASSGETQSKKTTHLSWAKSEMLEFSRLFNLCGPILICGVVIDFVAFIVIIFAKLSSAGQRQYAGKCVQCFFSYRRRWILLFSGLLATASILTLVSTLLFLSSPAAYKHDTERRQNAPCKEGPCVKWAGSTPNGSIFHNWGPSYGWYVYYLFRTIRFIRSRSSLSPH